MANETLVLYVFGLLVFGLLIFSYRQFAYGRTHSARVQKDGGSPFIGGTFLMEFVYWMFLPVGRLLVKIRVSPNFISFLCLLLSIGAGVIFAFGNFALAGWIWFLGSIMDALDGMVARAQNTVSQAGAVIDSTVDRVAELAAFSGLLIYYHDNIFAMLAVLGTLMGSMLTSYITAKGDILRLKVPRGFMRRAERAVYIGAAALFSPLLASFLEPHAIYPQYHFMIAILLLVAVVSNASVIYRVHWLCTELNKNS